MNDGLHLCFLALITFLTWVQLFSLYDDYGFLIRGLVLSSGVSQTFTSADRWLSYGHFPLSNLYESLGFLSWVLTAAVIVVQLNLPTLTIVVDRQLQSTIVDRLPDRWVPLVLNRGSMGLPKRNPMPSWAEGPRTVGLYHDLFGAIVMPVVTLVNLFAFCLPASFKRGSDLVPALQSNWLAMHVVVMIAAYGFLLLGCCFALAYLVVRTVYSDSDDDDDDGVLYPRHDRKRARGSNTGVGHDATLKSDSPRSRGPALTTTLHACEPNAALNVGAPPETYDPLRRASPVPGVRNRTPGTGDRSPNKRTPRTRTEQRIVGVDAHPGRRSPDKHTFTVNQLQALTRTWDNQSYRSIGLGFPLLTLGLLSGAVWANQTWGSYWSWDPKETWALVTWFIFAIYLHTRLSRGWDGSKSAGLALVGFGSLWVCYLGVNLMAKGLHSYGFFGGA